MANDADSLLKILIEIGVIGQDKAEEARKALAQVKEDSADVGSENTKLGSTMADLGQTEEKLNITHREMHMLLRSMGAEHIPGLSQALMALHSGPMILTIGGFIALFSAVKNVIAAFHDVAEATKKAADASADIDFDAWKDHVKDLQEAATAANAYAEGLTKVRDINEELKTQAEFSNAVAKAKEEGDKEVLKAQEDAAVKKIEQDKEAEKAHRAALHMTGGEAEMEARYKAQEEAVRTKFRDAGQAQGFQGDEAGIPREEAGLSLRIGKGQDLTKAAADATAAYQSTKGEDVSATKAASDLFTGQLKEASEKLAEFNRRWISSPIHGTNDQAAIAAQQERVDNLTKVVGEFNQELEDHTQAVARAKKQMDEAIKARDDNTKAMQTETDLIEQHIAVLVTRLQGSKAAATAEGDSGAIGLLNKILDRLDADKVKFDDLARRVDNHGT